MKYLTLAATAVMMMASSGEVKAASSCDSWFPTTADKCSDYSVINPHYWACRSLFLTVNTLCKGIWPLSEAKIAAAQEACQPGKNHDDCKKELGDVATDINGIQSQINTVLPKVQQQLDQEIEGAAKSVTAK